MGILEIANLRKAYRSPSGESSLVIDVPEFSLEQARQMALQGSSGSGKTTFLHLIAGILQPDGGTIRVCGEQMSGQPEEVRDRIRAKHIGYVFQTFNLLQGYTALENVAIAMSFAKKLNLAFARDLLKRVGLGDRMDYRPRQLSVGQQQRVAVARALANHPRLVLADEPTGNLDPVHARDALQLVQEICRENEAALLLVSHDQSILSQFEAVRSLSNLNRATFQPVDQADASATASGGAE